MESPPPGAGRAGAVAPGPLAGRRILVTRPAEQAESFAALLRKRGAEPIVLPLVRIEREASEELRRAGWEAGVYDWLVFTSANGVAAFFAAIDEGARSVAPGSVRIAVVGPATRRAVEAAGARVTIEAATHMAEGLVEELRRATELPGKRILYPRAEGARETLVAALRQAGAVVDDIVAYRTIRDDGSAAELERIVRNRAVDVVTFTSASAVESFTQSVGSDVHFARVAVIGPVTRAAAEAAGMRVDIESETYTTAALADAIEAHYSGLERDG